MRKMHFSRYVLWLRWSLSQPKSNVPTCPNGTTGSEIVWNVDSRCENSVAQILTPFMLFLKHDFPIFGQTLCFLVLAAQVRVLRTNLTAGSRDIIIFLKKFPKLGACGKPSTRKPHGMTRRAALCILTPSFEFTSICSSHFQLQIQKSFIFLAFFNIFENFRKFCNMKKNFPHP